MKIKVKKRDGSIEDFDPGKIKNVVIAAGLTEKDADKLVKQVVKWVNSQGRNEVTSLQIRDRILVDIQKMDDYAAKKYIWWEKYKDKNFSN